MEQASNVFNKGLQLDTHPMVLGNDTLTDCLNGTLITMAGNEAILQNDMGNRRVNNAFLPPGYEPVGMKEYGGVIYIAAYNPITNKSQIGSFPSPLKKIDSIDNEELGGTFDFSKFFDKSNIEEINNDIKYLKNDSFLIPITGDTSLHSGDKFAIWSFGLSSLKDLLTNYENINESETKVYSPKNRKYTLQIGILNSLNEFVDITKTLSRWKGNLLLNYNDSKSDLFKFNDGYFISDGFENTLDGTIEDTKLIKRRQQMAANTYSYKLVGPMYLKVNLNHIENFNYDIYGEYNRVKKTATLTIEGYITYNCPDGLLKTGTGSSELYEDFEEGDLTSFNAFMLYNETEKKDSRPNVENTVYDNNSNTYSTKITRTYENIHPNVVNTDLYNYTILVPAIAYEELDVSCEELDVYLKGLSVNGLIDLSLFGSGIIDVSEWRFFNDLKEEKTYFTTRFNAYPKYNLKFDNLKLIFTNLTDGTDVVEYPEDKSLPLYNGRNTILIEWNGKFKKNATYKVSILYDIIDKSTNEILETKIINDVTDKDNWKRWFLTTELFNDLYNEVFDFCYPAEEVKNKVEEKLQIQLAVDGTINETKKGIGINLNGNLFTTNRLEYIKYSSENKLEITLDVINTHSSIESYENYPDYVTAKDNIKFRLLKSIKYSIDNGQLFDKDSIINIDVETKEGARLTDDVRNNYSNKYLYIEESTASNPITITITNNDFYCGKPELSVTNVKNVFSKLSNIIPDSMPRREHYAGILPNFDSKNGSPDGHFLEVVTSLEKDWLDYLPSNDSRPDTWKRIAQEYKDGLIEFDLRIYKPNIFLYFTNLAFDGQMFTYYFPSLLIKYSYDEEKGNTKARVWWKKLDNTWALFKFLLQKDQEGNITKEKFTEFIKDEFGDPVYCMYNNYNGITGLLTADNNYIHNLEYSFTLQIYLLFELDGEYSEFINTEDYGNLKFRATIPTTFTKKCSDISIKSNSNYQDTVNTFNPSNISNIYLDIENSEVIVSDTDFAGNKLDINKIYYIYDDDGKLYNVDNPKVKVDFNQQVRGKNVLLYNDNTTGYPWYQTDESSSGKDNDSLTRLLYKDAFTIVKPLTWYSYTNY